MWAIVVPDGQVVRLDFHTFNTKDNYDLVEVYDGCMENDPLIGSYSGDNIPSPIVSTGTELLISFTSDAWEKKPRIRSNCFWCR